MQAGRVFCLFDFWGIFLELFFFFGCTTQRSMWELSSLTRDRTRAPCIGSAES